MTCTAWNPSDYCTTGPVTHHPRRWQHPDWLCPKHLALALEAHHD